MSWYFDIAQLVFLLVKLIKLEWIPDYVGGLMGLALRATFQVYAL